MRIRSIGQILIIKIGRIGGKMQDLSFYPINQQFSVGKYTFLLTVYTFDNVYTLDPQYTEIEKKDNKIFAQCKQLLWAGGQEHAKGEVYIWAETDGEKLKVKANARMEEAKRCIRCVKIALLGLEKGRLINLVDSRPQEIPQEGLCRRYPEAWREVGTPLVIMEQEEKYWYFRSLDTKVRQKRFAFLPDDENKVTVELIFEELATEFQNFIEVPEWEIGCAASLEEIYEPHLRHIEKIYQIQKWEERADVPPWFREISLIASVHGQHWSGYIFNDYGDMLRQLQCLCEKVEGRKILAYLPGWEGRYYWQYGDYRPDPRMGGEAGLKRLCDGAKKLGVHLMFMFGINGAGTNMEGYQTWGLPSLETRPSGHHECGSVDWDGSRHYDHKCNGMLNPGAPQWKNRLCAQIKEIVDKYECEGVFLDISAGWVNDPNFAYYDGVKELVGRIRREHPELLVAGEAWYDGLTSVFPLVQCGHTEGKLHWYDERYPSMIDSYIRTFGHLCLGDPKDYSTGVHELGRNKEWKTPLRKGIIPTITITKGTLEGDSERVDEIIEMSKRYSSLFCG